MQQTGMTSANGSFRIVAQAAGATTPHHNRPRKRTHTPSYTPAQLPAWQEVLEMQVSRTAHEQQEQQAAPYYWRRLGAFPKGLATENAMEIIKTKVDSLQGRRATRGQPLTAAERARLLQADRVLELQDLILDEEIRVYQKRKAQLEAAQAGTSVSSQQLQQYQQAYEESLAVMLGIAAAYLQLKRCIKQHQGILAEREQRRREAWLIWGHVKSK